MLAALIVGIVTVLTWNDDLWVSLRNLTESRWEDDPRSETRQICDLFPNTQVLQLRNLYTPFGYLSLYLLTFFQRIHRLPI